MAASLPPTVDSMEHSLPYLIGIGLTDSFVPHDGEDLLIGLLHPFAAESPQIGDGLLGDLSHILDASQVGAEVELAASSRLIAASALWAGEAPLLEQKLLQQCTLSGGDDYELCFTAPVSARAAVQAAAVSANTAVHRIGRITAQPGLRVLDEQGQALDLTQLRSFDHFANS